LTTKTGELISELNIIKGVMVENIDKLINRDQKLEIMCSKSSNLKENSSKISAFV
jgi:hypothetical protein